MKTGSMITEQQLIKRYMEGISKDVLAYAADGRISAPLAEKITADIDPDNENVFCLRLLAEIGVKNGFNGFRRDLIPRLKGLYRFSLVKHAYYQNAYSRLPEMLKERKTDFICGYYGSLLLGYDAKNPHRSPDIFDLVVHSRDHAEVSGLLEHVPEQYQPSFRVKVLACDESCVWEHALAAESGGTRLKYLDPTSMLLLNGEHICSSMKEWEMRSAVLADRMHWLQEYRVLRAHGEGIDLRVLSETAAGNARCAVRYILKYAACFFGDQEISDGLEKYLPQDAAYREFLRENVVPQKDGRT